ncbi:MAG: protein translocase subunit SecF, partial [Planctomycetota bacterium]
VEVKGFALTLGIGIVGTLFSALFVTRLIFDLYARFSGAKTLPMLPLVWNGLERALSPKIQWTRYRRFFWTGSAIAMVLCVMATVDNWGEMLDTEFQGGSSVVFSLKEDPQTGEQIMLPRAEVESRIREWAEAEFAETEALPADDPRKMTLSVKSAFVGATVLNFNIDEVVGQDFRGAQFVVKTTIEDPRVIERAVTEIFIDELDQEPPISFEFSEAFDPDLADFDAALAPVYPITDPNLGQNINDPTVVEDDRRFLGGVAIVLRDLQPAVTLDEIERRMERTRSDPAYSDAFGRPTRVVGITPAEGTSGQWRDVVVLVRDDSIDLFNQRELWEQQVQELEWNLIHTALTEPPTLEQVTQIDASIATQFRQQAIVAIFMSLLGILAYIWFRFGSFRYSAAAIAALVHDVIITLGLLSATHYIWTTTFARWFYIEPFKIDLGVIAALLTIIGYSLNDTIVILDRIRENRGKLPVTTADVVNTSVNQTISRTLLTSGTTLVAIIIMYWEGGTGIRPFTFAMLCGILVGTYSSIGIAAPLVFRDRSTPRGLEEDEGEASSAEGGPRSLAPES